MPGYADSGLMYHKLGKSLDKEYKVLALDLPMIHNPDKIYDLKELTDFVKEFAESLNLNDFVLAGFSACGLIAVVYAYNYPGKLRELILLNSIPRFIISKPLRRVFNYLKPVFLHRLPLYIYSRMNSSKAVRKLVKAPYISEFTAQRMRDFYYSVFGTAANLVGESVLVRFKKARVKKKIIFFKDDTIIPWERYQKQVEKLDCEVIVFSEGLHADKRIYWEKLKTLWLKSPIIKFQDVSIEKTKYAKNN